MFQETKQVIKRLKKGDMATKLARFLLSQHILPHSTTEKSPAELLMGRITVKRGTGFTQTYKQRW